jgi:hypothetical protein
MFETTMSKVERELLDIRFFFHRTVEYNHLPLFEYYILDLPEAADATQMVCA